MMLGKVVSAGVFFVLPIVYGAYVFHCGPCICEPLVSGGFEANCTKNADLKTVSLDSFSGVVQRELVRVDMRGTVFCLRGRSTVDLPFEVLCDDMSSVAHASGPEDSPGARDTDAEHSTGTILGGVALCLAVLGCVVLGVAQYRVSFLFYYSVLCKPQKNRTKKIK